MRPPPVRGRLAGLLLALALSIGAAGAEAEPIVFGQSAALSGPAAALGRKMRLGLLAAFGEANRNGGVDGRKLELVSRDDRYEPEQAIDNTKRLIRDDQVFALVGEVGTPTSRVAAPIATAAGVPFVGAFSGAELLRDPYRPTIVNVRASYFEETETAVAHLTADLHVKRVAVLFQDDSFGRAGYAGVKLALERRGLTIVSAGSFPRNSTAVKSGLLDAFEGNPEAVVMIGPYQPVAAFVRWARKLGKTQTLVTVSFVGASALADALGTAGAGVVVTQVMPFFGDASIPLVAAYRAALAAEDPKAEPDEVSLEGYVVGRVAAEAVRRVHGALTREAFLAVFQDPTPFSLGGLAMRFGPGDNQGSDAVFLTMIDKAGTVVPVSGLAAP